MTRHLTYANVAATCALVLAMGGTAMAAGALIDGKSIEKQSIPGNRIKRDGLTGKQVKEAKLGTVPDAIHASRADSAGKATTADQAKVAEALTGGLTAASFVPSERVRVGSAPSDAISRTILELPTLGVRVETDELDTSTKRIVLRNTGAANIGLTLHNVASVLEPGNTAYRNAGGYDGDGAYESTSLLQSVDGAHAAVLRCWYPSAGFGTFAITCVAFAS